jgi:hypothetical protein
MASQSIPCPQCGRLNRIEAKTCAGCQYAFVPGADGGEGNIFKRVVGKLTRAR